MTANSQDLLNQLRDVHLPHAVPWWPPAPGWFILVGVIFVTSVLTGFYYFRRHFRQRHQRAAIKLFHQLCQEHRRNPKVLCAEISTLLRRTALALYPRKTVAGLQGKAWLKFLDESGGCQHFCHGAGKVLVSLPYQKENTVALQPLIAVVEQWLEHLKKYPPNDK